jgi:urease accessory protein
VEGGVKAAATIVAEAGRRRSTRCTTLRSSPPISLRDTPDGLHIVGSAAGPIGGDDIHLDITVAGGAALTVRTVAAQVALPGPDGRPSSSTITATVGAGATLRWLPDPLVLAAACDHRLTVTLSLSPTATLVWREEIVLGRTGEVGGSLLQRLRVDRGDRPLLRNDLALGPRWPGAGGPAGSGGDRVVANLLVVGQPVRQLGVDPSVRAAICRVAPGAVLVTAVGGSVESVSQVLAQAVC